MRWNFWTNNEIFSKLCDKLIFDLVLGKYTILFDSTLNDNMY